MANEGADKPALIRQTDTSKRYNLPRSSIRTRRMSEADFDASNKTKRTHVNQRISSRKRKRNKPKSAFHAMVARAEKMHRRIKNRQHIKTKDSFKILAHLACLPNG